jgi:hypothetical protein
MQIGDCQANEFMYWGYFTKINLMSPKVVVAWLKTKGIIKRDIVDSL